MELDWDAEQERLYPIFTGATSETEEINTPPPDKEHEASFVKFDVDFKVTFEILRLSKWSQGSQNVFFFLCTCFGFGFGCWGLISLSFIFSPKELLVFMGLFAAAFWAIQQISKIEIQKNGTKQK